MSDRIWPQLAYGWLILRLLSEAYPREAPRVGKSEAHAIRHLPERGQRAAHTYTRHREAGLKDPSRERRLPRPVRRVWTALAGQMEPRTTTTSREDE